MSKEIELKDAKCTKLSILKPVQFKPEGKADIDFVIEAYTGEVVDRWWGKLVVAIDGIKAKKNIPIFRDHIRNQIVGFSKDTWKDGSFFVSGKFSGATSHAQEVKALATEGFPWQASIGVMPSKILSVEKDAEHEVNGKKIKGPAEVWLQSRVFETSFVPFGADDKTNISVFSVEEMEQPEQEGKHMEITADFLKKNHPAIVAALIAEGLTAALLREKHPDIVTELTASAGAEGAAAERERIQAVLAQSMPGHEELVNTLAFDGKTTAEQAAVQILAAEKKIRDSVKDKLGSDSIKPVDHSVPPATDAKPEDDKDLPVEERAKAEWDKDAKLRTEFSNDYDAYLAYRKATDKGQVRVLKGAAKV